MNLRKIRLDEVEMKITTAEELESFRNHFDAMAPSDRTELEKEINSRLEKGDMWAWCTIITTVHWNGFVGTSTRGCCHYKSESEFMNDGTDVDMVNEALDDLNNNVQKSWEIASQLAMKEA